MQIFYRISDQSYKKFKLYGTDKFLCLENFLYLLRPSDHIFVIADRCLPDTVERIKKIIPEKADFEETNLGNSGSLWHVIQQACSASNECIYFVEDDYLHRHNSLDVIEEGLGIGDYVTVFDHPDKYSHEYGLGEISQVKRTQTCHWRYTVSTCMTFATKKEIIEEDLEIWRKHTTSNHPHDHDCFSQLGNKGRKLALSIPGFAFHTDLTWQFTHGATISQPKFVEKWAVEMMTTVMENKIRSMKDPDDHVDLGIFLGDPNRRLAYLWFAYNDMIFEDCSKDLSS